MRDYLSRAGKTILIMIFVVCAVIIVHRVANKEQEGVASGQTAEIVADIPQNPIQATFDDLLDAIEQVESRGNSNAVGDGGAAIGAYQIHKIYVDDVNRIYKLYIRPMYRKDTFNYKDRWNRDKSREMAKIYLRHYGKDKSFEDMARIHNGGPQGWKSPATEKYWFKIKNCLDNLQ